MVFFQNKVTKAIFLCEKCIEFDIYSFNFQVTSFDLIDKCEMKWRKSLLGRKTGFTLKKQDLVERKKL